MYGEIRNFAKLKHCLRGSVSYILGGRNCFKTVLCMINVEIIYLLIAWPQPAVYYYAVYGCWTYHSIVRVRNAAWQIHMIVNSWKSTCHPSRPFFHLSSTQPKHHSRLTFRKIETMIGILYCLLTISNSYTISSSPSAMTSFPYEIRRLFDDYDRRKQRTRELWRMVDCLLFAAVKWTIHRRQLRQVPPGEN